MNNCLVTIADFTDEQGGGTAFKDMPLRLEQGSVGELGQFSLRVGQTISVFVAQLKETNPDAEIELQYADPRPARGIARNKRLRIRVRAHADKGGPEEAEISLYVSHDGFLRAEMIMVSDEKPINRRWRRPYSRSPLGTAPGTPPRTRLG